MVLPITVSYHLPSKIRRRTKYSVDVSIYFVALSPELIETIPIDAFNPGNPDICFRNDALQPLGSDSCYLDIIWSLDAESPELAAQHVEDEIAAVIPVPEGLKFSHAELGESGDSPVYDNQKHEWCDLNW